MTTSTEVGTVDGTYPVETELEYQHESTGRILVYAPTREAETTPPDEIR